MPPVRPQMVLNIQMLRLLAAAAVVFFHAAPPVTPELAMPALPVWLRNIQAMGFAGVDVFFVISGAIMALTTRNRETGARSAARFGLQRFGRIYAGWWPFFILFVVAYTFIGHVDDKNLLASFWLWPVNINTLLPPIIWTLSFELYFYLVLALLLLLPGRGRYWGMAGFGAIVAVCTLVWWQAGRFTPARLGDSWPVQQFLLMPLVAEFVAGFLLCTWLRSNPQRPPARLAERAAWLLAAAAFGAIAGWYHLHVARFESGLAGFYHSPERALLLGGMGLALIGWALRAPAPRSRLVHLLAAGGDASYAIYLGHLLVMATCYWLAFATGWIESRPAWLMVYAFTLVAVFVYSLLHYRWIEQPLHRWVRGRVNRLFARNDRGV